MTNKEFYFDKLLAIAICGKSKCQSLHELVFGKGCQGKNCYDCECYTVERVENWLNAEYEEPEPQLLENGDGLNPGDWIMVRNNKDNEWEKFRFVCYYNNVFWTLYDAVDWFHIGSKIKPWIQARLPMEDE